jgi:hypothetical protein
VEAIPTLPMLREVKPAPLPVNDVAVTTPALIIFPLSSIIVVP